MTEPFATLPFARLPEHPRVPHTFAQVPARTTWVWTESFGDTRVTVRRLGEGPPLLLLHGLMTTGYSFRYVLPVLAEHFTCWVPDLVGAGDTDKPDVRYPPEAVAEWIDALVDALGIRGCACVGNSMGGYLAMWTALRHPTAFSKLVVLHAPALPTPRMWALWTAMRLPGAEALLARLVTRDPERWAHENVHYFDETLKSLEEARTYAAPLRSPEGLRGFARHLRDTMDARALARFTRVLRSRRQGHADFPCPIQLVYAHQDPMVPPAVGRTLSDLLPAAPFVWLRDASHFAHVDAPDAFLRASWPFLTGSTSRPPRRVAG